MLLRDELDAVVQAWHEYEAERGGLRIIDYDCTPRQYFAAGLDVTSRLDVLQRLVQVRDKASRSGDDSLVAVANAHIAYIRALLGSRPDLDSFISATQGCAANGWPESYLDQTRDCAIKYLGDLGVSWSNNTLRDLESIEEPISASLAPRAIRQEAEELESAVRRITRSTTNFNLSIESVDIPAYWEYWLDGHGSNIRLRINNKRARFTKVTARQFALHEILGHGLQSAGYAAYAASSDTPWTRLLSVHLPYQVMLEGIGQTLPLFVIPNDRHLVARVRLDHYLELVRATLHRRINNGTAVEGCVDIAKELVPFWPDSVIGDILTDRAVDPLLRSYLWAYPAGIDWFVSLADRGDADTIARVLRAAYQAPLVPAELAHLWPEGPPIGGYSGVGD